jgi:hypothetical protein
MCFVCKGKDKHSSSHVPRLHRYDPAGQLLERCEELLGTMMRMTGCEWTFDDEALDMYDKRQ